MTHVLPPDSPNPHQKGLKHELQGLSTALSNLLATLEEQKKAAFEAGYFQALGDVAKEFSNHPSKTVALVKNPMVLADTLKELHNNLAHGRK